MIVSHIHASQNLSFRYLAAFNWITFWRCISKTYKRGSIPSLKNARIFYQIFDLSNIFDKAQINWIFLSRCNLYLRTKITNSRSPLRDACWRECHWAARALERAWTAIVFFGRCAILPHSWFVAWFDGWYIRWSIGWNVSETVSLA